MRRLALFACICLATSVSAAPRAKLDTLTPAQAIARAASASPKPVRALFEFRVASAAAARDSYFLDSESEFRSAANLGVLIRASAMPGLTKKFGADLKSALVGKRIKLIGQARRLTIGRGRGPHTATQVEVTHAGQILSVD